MINITSYIIDKIKKTPLNDLVADADNREIVKGASTTLMLKITGLIFAYGKFWLDSICLARNKGVSPHIIREIERLVYEHSIFLMEKYNEYHSS